MRKISWKDRTVEEKVEWLLDKAFFGVIILWIIGGTIWIFMK